MALLCLVLSPGFLALNPELFGWLPKRKGGSLMSSAPGESVSRETSAGPGHWSTPLGRGGPALRSVK